MYYPIHNFRGCQAASLILVAMSALLSAVGHHMARAESTDQPHFEVPDGCVVEKVAGQPLVNYPLFACFDDQGRLYVAEGTGLNLPGEEIVDEKLGRITRLEDTDGDGLFDKSIVFADDLVFPQGVLWHDGVVYTASHPNVWRLEDTDGDGKADRREVLVGKFGFTGNGCDIHGPFLGPDGYLYMPEGRHGHDIQCPDGRHLKGQAARIFRFRTDGTRIERLAGGGFDNPVELAFTPEGEMVGTMDQWEGDQLLHYVEGGVYPQVKDPSVKELVDTGPPLGSIRGFSVAAPVALCGIERIRSAHFGSDHVGTLLTAQFNVHCVQQHRLTRDGATYRGSEKDFLVTLNHDVHPTDVLEDADGSLLMIDMGAWFNIGCPTSKIAKPEVKGVIYRIRHKDAPVAKDPWGKLVKWNAMSAEQLVDLLDDPRPKVRDKAMARLIKRDAQVISTLAKTVQAGDTQTLEKRRNALWTLSQISYTDARAAVRAALSCQNNSLRHVALHSVGLHRDAEALSALSSIVVSDEPALRLKAAEALGRIGDSTAVPALLESLRRGVADRFLEHSLIYALIRIDDRASTLAALTDPNPNVRRAGLIALDQMQSGNLTRQLAAPLLGTDDHQLQQTTLQIISRHEGWSGEIIDLVSQWLANPDMDADQKRSLTGALIAFSTEEDIQQIIADATHDPQTTLTTRLLLLEVMARSRTGEFPRHWHAPLRQTLGDANSRLVREAVATVRSRSLTAFDESLLRLSRDEGRPMELRIASLECVTPRLGQLPEELFTLLTDQLNEDVEPLLRASAARALGTSQLNDQQLIRLADTLADSGSLIVPLLTPAYQKSSLPKVGLTLVSALKRSPGADALTAADMNKLLKDYPAETQAAAKPLLEKLIARREQQAAYLAEVKHRLVQVKGDADRGRDVFFSKKAVCSSCHRMDDRGATVGPDLSKIGKLRSPTDLIEAVIFPNSSITLGFEPYSIVTGGLVHSGIIVRETSDAVYLRTNQLAEIRIPRNEIEELVRSDVSIMPQGLDKSLSAQELSDLLEFLYQRR